MIRITVVLHFFFKFRLDFLDGSCAVLRYPYTLYVIISDREMLVMLGVALRASVTHSLTNVRRNYDVIIVVCQGMSNV